ncbi:MAG TPA: PAS domain S-box protein [Spirochaetales bacterium]|nr:PAS domain S-box protein [Spirochaetales bacterium]
MIPEPSVSIIRDNYKKAIKEKRIVRWQETSEYPAWVKVGEVSISPFFDDIGICTHLVGSVHDITERKRAEENLEKESRMRMALLDNIPGCIALILKKGTREIVASNKVGPGDRCGSRPDMLQDMC